MVRRRPLLTGGEPPGALSHAPGGPLKRERSIGVISNRDGRWVAGCNYCGWREIFEVYSDADAKRHEHDCSDALRTERPRPKLKELVRLDELAEELAMSESTLRHRLADLAIDLLPMQKHLGINDASMVRQRLNPQ